MLLGQTLKNLGRTRQILGLLFEYGFEDVISSTSLINLVSEKRRLSWRRQDKSAFDYTRWERIRMVVEELGPTYVKFAQILSNRPDILPEALIDELQKLQSDVPPFPYEEVERIIKEETGKEIKELFGYFRKEPIGSASIGQVHKARLRNGDEVVVKVQRPGVKEIVATDLSIMKDLISRTESYLESQGIINVLDVILALEKTMSKELDYRTELRNIEQFKAFYKDEEDFYTPAPYKDYSGERVLTMEFADACKITDLKKIKEWGLDPKSIVERGMKLYLMQIFEYGYFHADPHPGNVLVRKDGVICLIDYGMMGKLMKRDKYAFAGIFIGMAQMDPRKMALSFKKLAIEDEIEDMRSFEYELNDLIEDFAMLDVGESDMAEFAARLQKIIYTYKMRVPKDIFLILRALTILEGIGKTIYPDFNTQSFVEPYGRKLVMEQYSMENIVEEMMFRSGRLVSFVNALPTDIRTLLKKARKGKLSVEVVHKGYESMQDTADRIANRLALTMIIVALLVSSAIIMTAKEGSFGSLASNGLPYLSFLGLLIAGALSVILLYNILRSRKY